MQAALEAERAKLAEARDEIARLKESLRVVDESDEYFEERMIAAEAKLDAVRRECTLVVTEAMVEKPWSEAGCFQRGLHRKANAILAIIDSDHIPLSETDSK